MSPMGLLMKWRQLLQLITGTKITLRVIVVCTDNLITSGNSINALARLQSYDSRTLQVASYIPLEPLDQVSVFQPSSLFLLFSPFHFLVFSLSRFFTSGTFCLTPASAFVAPDFCRPKLFWWAVRQSPSRLPSIWDILDPEHKHESRPQLKKQEIWAKLTRRAKAYSISSSAVIVSKIAYHLDSAHRNHNTHRP